MGGGAFTMALAQEAEPGNPLRKCWLAHEWLRVSEPPPRRGAAKAAADAPGAEAALAPELPKEPGGGAGGMAEGENAAVQAERSTPIKV